ncbi:MAG: gliding motility-associated C-terminal domain-containing protein [Saprospiraceae bacterium]|nr:gliding motility-associated C-terminal domain-containing protein [Saprospiraceae bacterium]MBP7680225.1 gliding motility-associated C-terminal domain-containing protein [Saprospiraceae bacterium]
MKPRNYILIFFISIFYITVGLAQIQVQVRIDNATATTTCADNPPFGGPDVYWAMRVNGGTWDNYPSQGFCPFFYDVPRVQYSADYACPADVPDSIEVCFNVYENDALLPCFINSDCSEIICLNFAIPNVGTTATNTLTLPTGLSSGGAANFTILTNALTPAAINDSICQAIDLGVLPYSGVLGDAAVSQYSNICATSNGDINTIPLGIWTNEQGVWFRFTTGAQVSVTNVFANNDPSDLGDTMDVQVAIFRASSDCNGTLTLVDWYGLEDNTYDATLQPCLLPNTTYYILVDGENTSPETREGYFSLALASYGVSQSPNRICDAMPLGTIPDAGNISTGMTNANHCADGIGDPANIGFQSQNSVWFSFYPPASGHVIIDVTSADTFPLGIDPIDLQVAVFTTFNDTCLGQKRKIIAVDNTYFPTETIELSCLDASRKYWILVDGSGNNTLPGSDATGVFSIDITDAGILPPADTTFINPVVCFGSSFTLGDSTYTQDGLVYEIFKNIDGCDSLVTGPLDVLDTISISIDTVQLASALGAADGVLQALPVGGTGTGYTYQWGNGQTTQQVGNLVGGDLMCVTITDGLGCSNSYCLEIPYVFEIFATIINDTLNCYGDTDALAQIIITSGQPPYNYNWEQVGNAAVMGSGTITTNGTPTFINNLAVGDYSITIVNQYTQKAFVANISQPDSISIQPTVQTNVSCFGVCDGEILIAPSGGTPTYQYNWSPNIQPLPHLTNLCADDYFVTVSDMNNCTNTIQITITQPPMFVATATQQQPVSCFGGNDGRAVISTTHNAAAYLWDNAETTSPATNLTAGNHFVTVTNADGCMDTTAVQITQPSAPATTITIVQPIRCDDSNDGIAAVAAQNLTPPLSYQWSSGSVGSTAAFLSPQQYFVTITDALGCTTTDDIILQAPPPIDIAYLKTDITCKEGETRGSIFIDTVFGGQPPYQYALNSSDFGDYTIFNNLDVGAYRLEVKDDLGCVEEYPIAITDGTEIYVFAGEDYIIELGEHVTIDALTLNSNIVFSWSSVGILPCVTCHRIEVQPLATTDYIIAIKDTLTECIARDTVRVQVSKEEDIFIPNAFTPNNDGFNDVFMILAGNSIALINNLRVYDRWGTLLFTAQNFPPNAQEYGWNGKFNNQDLNPAVFVYFVEATYIDGAKIHLKGDVTLLR